MTRITLAALLTLTVAQLAAQVVPGRNVNMVAGTTWPDGDPFLQRQNEPSIAASSRNLLHLLAGANDYRTVDLPGHPGDKPTADAWLGVFKSFNGGKTWTSTLLPGYPQDTSAVGAASPLKAYDAAADPVVRAGANGLLVYSGIAFGHTAPIGASPVQAALSDGPNRAKRSKVAARKPAPKKAPRRTSRAAEKEAGHGGTKSAVFVSLFVDLNNRENGDMMPFVRTTLVDTDPGVRFLDKQWIAVDVPRPGAPTCTLLVPQQSGGPVQQSFAAGRIYIVYTALTGSGASLAGQILFSSSSDCGATWTTPKDLSTSPDPDLDNDGVVTNGDLNLVKAAYGKRCGNVGFNPAADANGDCLVNVNDLAFVSRNLGKPYSTARRVPQAATIALDPLTGSLNIAWREFKSGGLPDAIRFVRSTNGGASFSTPITVASVNPFDQGTTQTSFRSSAFPTMAHDGTRLYLAFSARGHASARPDPIIGDARIVLYTSVDGISWSGPSVADDTPALGHQFMPALAFGGGQLWLLYYDLRQDLSQVFGPFVDELAILAVPPTPRHTLDVRIAHAAPAVDPSFTSKQLSEYVTGVIPGSSNSVQLQFNPPNLPLFRQGSVPFIGDYIDLITSPTMRSNSDGTWSFNIEPTSTDGGGHAVWTENRNVRVIAAVQDPVTGFVSVPGYTPPNSPSRGAMSLYDSTTLLPPCDPDFTGTRNQDVYSARFDSGLMAVALGNTKPLGIVERGFALQIENATPDIRSYRLTILNQPPGGDASFQQFTPPGNPLAVLDVSIPPFSTVARTAYVTSLDPDARIDIDVSEIAAPGDPNPIPGGRHGTIVLNPDPSTPAIQNPAIQNPAIQNASILTEEFYTAKIAPAIQNPAIQNPAIQNPAIQNPAIQNVTVANPTVVNPAIQNPAIQNPAIQNPAIQNPAIQNAALPNGSFTDTTWELTNDGNTATAYAVRLLLNGPGLPPGFVSQLVIHKTYTTPAADTDCSLKVQLHNVVVSNITNPGFTTNPADLSNPAIQNPAIQNATVALLPGERASVTLRVFDPNMFDQVTFNAAANVTTAAVPQSVDSTPAQNGVTQPTAAISLTILTPLLADAVLGGGPYLQQLTANVPGTWAIVAGGLPNGLNLNAVTGVISGTPTAAGTFAFTILFTSSADPTQTVTRHFVITVGQTMAIVTNALSAGQVGTPYTDQIVVTGGVGNLTFAVTQGALPAGLSLGPATGAITGTPTANGASIFDVTVTDSALPPNSVTKTLSIVIGNFGVTDLEITTISVNPNPVNVGHNYLGFTATITNIGPNVADALLVWSLPPSAVLRFPGSCGPVGRLAICSVGAIAPGAVNQQHIMMEVTPQVGGVTLVTTARIIAADTNPANDIASASATVVGAGTRHVWTANAGAVAAITRIDPDTNAVLGTVQLAAPAYDIAFTPDGTRAYAVQHTADQVVVLDVATGGVVDTASLAAPNRAKAHPDGTRVYVTHGGSFVSVLDTATNSLITSIAVGSDPHGMAFSPDGSKLYVANRNSDTVSVIDTNTDTLDETIQLTPGDFPVDVAVSPDLRYVYVTNYFGGNVAVIGVFADIVETTIPVGLGPQGVAFSPDGKRAYVANFDDNTVSVIDTDTNTVIATPVVPGSPNGIIVSPDGDRYFVTGYNANVVHVLSTATNQIIMTIDVGTFPAYLDYARLP